MAGHLPRSLDVIGDEVVIVWDDAHESYYPAELLRRSCPCASCTGEPDFFGRGLRARPEDYPPQAFELRRLERVGAYAMQPSWGDGHATGIFAWTALRALCPCGAHPHP